MSCKIDAIMKLLEAKGQVVVSFERGVSVQRITITKLSCGGVMVGTHPGARVARTTIEDSRSALEGLRMFIKGWK